MIRLMKTPLRLYLLPIAWLLAASPALEAASPPAVEARHGMVVSSQALASQVGVEILKQGGNAVDAAVATGYALAVVNPCCGNIGGGGFMTIHLADGRDTFINFREKAPQRAGADMYLHGKSDASLEGWLAAGVPGTVLGLESARVKYGSLPREKLMAPAIRLARQGFILTRGDTDVLQSKTRRFRRQPYVARIFLRADGSPLQPGDRLVQKDLANTLERIARQGPKAFYQGALPAAVQAASRQGGGILSAQDFADYRIGESAPLSCSYRGYDILSAAPPSSGGVTLCETLNILENYDLKSMGANSAAAIHAQVEAMRRAYQDRNHLGDPDFVNNPLDRLLDKGYAAQAQRRIPSERAGISGKPQGTTHERPQTTHYSVIDSRGNAVATTYTVNGFFGAGVMAPGTGFFINNEMDDFNTRPGMPNLFGLIQGSSNGVAPGKRPLSSMSPTLVTKNGHIYLVLGSPGGSRIPSIALQVICNIIDFGMGPQEAVDAPRIHHQWLPDEVYYEQRGLSADTLDRLKTMGYRMTEQTPWGAAELILVGLPGVGNARPASSGNDAALSGEVLAGYLYGSNDVRRPAGSAVGY